MVLSTVFLVPASQPTDATHQHSLASAMSMAGVAGTVIIEPGAAPDPGIVSVTLEDITIQGDPLFAAASLPFYDLNITATGVTLTNLNLGTITLGAAASDTTVTRSQLVDFIETGATSGAGHNTLSHNLILGSIDLQGNSALLQATGDLVESNQFVTADSIAIKLTNSNTTIIRDNHIVSSALSGFGIQVRSNSDQVTISGNTVEMIGAGSPIAVDLINTGGAAGNIVGAKVLNNTLTTGDLGTGLYINIFGTGASMVAQIEGNEFSDNKVGIDINGLTNVATGAGNIDIGGGSNAFGTSRGANKFRGFDGQNGHFALNLHNTDAGITVSAQQNIFDNGISAGSVVRDQNNAAGSGVLNVSNALDAEHAYVQSLFGKVLRRTGDTGSGGEVDQLLAQLNAKGQRAVAKSLLYSDESLGRMINDVYSDFLDRDPSAAELTKGVKQLKSGKSITAVEAAVLGSVEFQSRLNTDFVQALYLDVLHRPATSSELTKAYKSVKTLGLAGVAAKVTGSKERRLNAAGDYYRDLLHREPGTGEAEALAAKPGTLLNLELLVLSSEDYFDHG